MKDAIGYQRLAVPLRLAGSVRLSETSVTLDGEPRSP